MAENAFKVTMFFPLRDNDGNAFSEETWEWWRGTLTNLLCGFTDMGVVQGWWEGHSDENRWIIAVVQTEHEIGNIKDFLRRSCEKFAQKKMYLDYHSVHFEEVS